MKNLSNLEIEVMLEGTIKAIKELQQSTKKDYSKSINKAIQNELQEKYIWFNSLTNERNSRQYN